jgi:Ca2+-binding EF-hand superfamily protein
MSYIRPLAISAVLFSCAGFHDESHADEQLEKDLTKLLDGNQDGEITDKEAKRGARTITQRSGANDATGKKLREALDKNQDGRVDAEEAKAAVERSRNVQNPGRFMNELFQHGDKNRDGALSEKEFDKVLELIADANPEGAKKLSKIYQFMDRDGNGLLTRKEADTVTKFLGELGGNGKSKEGEEENKFLQHAEKTLNGLDADGNGVLNRREASKNRRLAKVFQDADADKDGELTVLEMAAFLKQSAQAAAAKERQ